MPRTPAASAAVRDATRARIRTAAVLLMAEQGYRATTLRQVAEKAGVANGLPSHYFGSKDGLLIDIADSWRQRTRAAIAAAAGKGPAASLRLLVRSALLGLDSTPEEVQEGRAVASLLADPEARRVLRAAGADDQSADLMRVLEEGVRAVGTADPTGDRLLVLAAIRGGLSLASEDPAFPLRQLEQALLAHVLPDGETGCSEHRLS